MTPSDDPRVPSAAEGGAAEPSPAAESSPTEFGTTADDPTAASEAAPDRPKQRLIRRGGPAPSAAGVAAPSAAATPASSANPNRAMIPARGTRPLVESVLMRVIATAGVIGISVAIAAIMGSQHSKGWLIGLVTSLVSVLLAAVLWSSQRL